jgi:arylsulfatase
MRFRRDVLQTSSLIVLLLGLTALSGPAGGQGVTGDWVRPAPRPPSRKTNSATAGRVRRRDQGEGFGVKPWWAPRVVPPKGAPNVLLIMTDDAGFGAPGTFGGVIPTPALDRIAAQGLRYTNFHSTALCSPTRAGDHHGPQPSLGGPRRW